MTKLPYVVECLSNNLYFEPIAAFDVDSIAIDYASDCSIANPTLTYRVVKGKKILASNKTGKWEK